ncbi:GNAT family N-acetyltransferase [Granulicatella sp. WM01]|uniref:GNAT family N-acetyltransferase n=2 Tax=unclassified Granulicatella TaxID=2630493 RepID=UPI0014319615|nr:GNAT family N-acetyltransferase [Granulicatella sp. WM01]
MVNIRLANLDDAKQMSQVHARTWKVAYKGIFAQSYLNQLPDTAWEESFKRGIQAKKSLFLVAEVDHQIVGCITGGRTRWTDEEKGEIYSLYVLPEYQHQGIGKSLVITILESLYCQYNSVYVLAVDRNTKARRFYECLGFKDTGQIKKSELHGAVFSNCLYEKMKKVNY